MKESDDPRRDGRSCSPSQLKISKVQDVFNEKEELIDSNYERPLERFLNEFDWDVDSLSEQRKKGTPY